MAADYSRRLDDDKIQKILRCFKTLGGSPYGDFTAEDVVNLAKPRDNFSSAKKIIIRIVDGHSNG